MKHHIGMIAAALLAGAAVPAHAGSVSASSEAHYQFSIYSNQIDAYNSTDGSSTYSGNGTYSVTPDSVGSYGGGVGAAGGEASARWSATADSPPISGALVDQAWFPLVDAFGKPLPIYHIYNGTEFAVQMQIQLVYSSLSSGMVTGDAGVSIFNQIGFHIDCTACSGLSGTDFTGGDALQAGSYFGGSDGAFNSSKSNAWILDFTLNAFSGLGLFASASSSGTLVANGAGSAVPEPANWAMMIVGMGGIGGMLRSVRGRRAQVAHA